MFYFTFHGLVRRGAHALLPFTLMLPASLGLLGCGPDPQKFCNHASSLAKDVSMSDCLKAAERARTKRADEFKKVYECVLQAQNEKSVKECGSPHFRYSSHDTMEKLKAGTEATVKLHKILELKVTESEKSGDAKELAKDQAELEAHKSTMRQLQGILKDLGDFYKD
jgi:hypothetical protein